MEKGEIAKNPVKAAKNTIRIVEVLMELNGAGVTELENHLDLPKSSIHNYLSTLREEGYVIKDGTEYAVSVWFLTFGGYARHQYQVYDLAKEEMNKIANETGELVNLLVEEHGKGVILHKVSGETAVNVDTWTGFRIPLHNNSLGKAVLSHLSKDRVKEIINRYGLPRTTENTITEQSALLDELDKIRERGVAFDREERLRGLKCVAAPIVNKDGNPEGAISISAPAGRLDDTRLEEELSNLLRSSTNVIELNLTYS